MRFGQTRVARAARIGGGGVQRGDAEGYVGGGTNGNAKRRMRYESAFLLADAPPPDAPPPLPRVWDPARRNERGNGRGEDQTDADADAE